MVLTALNWDEIQNLNLQLLGAKTTGKRWVSDLIWKFWDTAWDVWNYHTDGPRKIEIIKLIDKRFTYHLNKCRQGLISHCHFLLLKSTHTLLDRPVYQPLSWI